MARFEQSLCRIQPYTLCLRRSALGRPPSAVCTERCFVGRSATPGSLMQVWASALWAQCGPHGRHLRSVYSGIYAASGSQVRCATHRSAAWNGMPFEGMASVLAAFAVERPHTVRPVRGLWVAVWLGAVCVPLYIRTAHLEKHLVSLIRPRLRQGSESGQERT